MFALKQNKVVPCTKWMMDCGWIRCRFKNGRGSWCPASLTHRRPVPCSCRGVQTVWTRVRAYLPPHRLPRKIDLDGRLVTHEPWWSLSSLLSVCPPHPLPAVRRGSSDPHEEPPGVRRGAGRRHPHGLQRFQLPALRPLLVRDQRREWARYRTCWLPARRFTPTFFFVMCAARTEAASRLPVGVNVGYVKQPRSLFFHASTLHSRASQPCTPSLQVSAFIFIHFLLQLTDRSGTHVTAVSHIISPALLQVFDRNTVSVWWDNPLPLSLKFVSLKWFN